MKLIETPVERPTHPPLQKETCFANIFSLPPSSSILSGGQGHGGHGHPLNEKFSHSLIIKVDVIIRKRKRILGNIELRNVSNLQTCQQNFCVNTAENKNIVKYKNGQFHHLY